MTLDGFLHPALALVNRMRFSRKFGILFALIFVPLVLLAGYLIHEQNSSIDFVESERHGLAYIEAVREPIEYLQQHRGAMGAVLAGSNDAGERARRLRRLTDETLADLEEVRNGPRFSDKPISEISGTLRPPAARQVHRNTRRPVFAGPAPYDGAGRCRNESTDRALARVPAGSRRP